MSMIIVTDDPHTMRSRSDEFGDGGGECGRRINCEYGDLILSVSNALFEFYDGEKVGAC
jgi:hypothetical protein